MIWTTFFNSNKEEAIWRLQIFISYTCQFLCEKMSGRGALIVVEGIDRSGKTTQCLKLFKTLSENYSVKLMKFPDRTTDTGKMINSYLQRGKELNDHAVHLLFSANRWEQSEKMLDDLRDGTTLIVDRYAYSGAAFTGAKSGFHLEWCKSADSGLPDPDLVLFLNLSTTEAEMRGGYGDERYEEVKFQERVSKNFMNLMSKQWKVIDASRSLEDVQNEIVSLANDVIAEVRHKPIGKLWAVPTIKLL